MNMKLEWLNYFIALSESSSFHEAAKKLHLTQQNLSYHIKHLEQALETELFERNSKGTQLSPAGRRFLPKAYELVSKLNTLDQRLNQRLEELSGSLRIGYCLVWREPFIEKALSQLISKHKQIFPDLRFGLEQALALQQLFERQLDFVVTATSTPSFNHLVIAQAESCIVAAQPGHKKWDQLQYIALDPDPLEWPPHAFYRQQIAQTNHFDMALNLCQLGVGALFAPRQRVQHALDQERLFEVATVPFDNQTPVYLYWHPESQKNRLFEQFIDTIQAIQNP